jgi:uncharacterized protein
MTRSHALILLTQHERTLQQMGVTALSIFGSVARDEAGDDSDVDILVDFETPATFDRYMDVKFYLEDLLQKPVDLVTWPSLKPQLRDVIEREAIRVA